MPRRRYLKQETRATLGGLTDTLHRRWLGLQPQSLLYMRLGRPAQRIITPPGSHLRQIMRVKNQRAPERILRDTLPPLWPHPIMTLTIHNIVILRIETENAGIRSIVISERVVRPMLRSRETGGVAG